MMVGFALEGDRPVGGVKIAAAKIANNKLDEVPYIKREDEHLESLREVYALVVHELRIVEKLSVEDEDEGKKGDGKGAPAGEHAGPKSADDDDSPHGA